MIIEIISPSTDRKDKIEKFNKYELAKVKEIGLLNPKKKL